jgi:phosphonate transport system substrate-binding protein
MIFILSCFLCHIPLNALAESVVPQKLVLGFIPDESESALRKRYGSLIAHVEKQLNVTIELHFAKERARVITEMKDKKLDIAFHGPKSYVEASEQAGAVAFARILSKNGSEGYHSVIVTLKDSGLKQFADLKGKRWLYTDPDSTSGTLIPNMFFYLEARIDPAQYFSHIDYSGSHQNSIAALKNRTADAVAVSDDLLRRGKDNDWSADAEEFTVVWRSELIPNSLFAYRQDLSEELKRAIETAFLSFRDKEGLEHNQLVPAKDQDYSFIRKMLDYQKRLAARRH